jgi:hypothetical protein
VKPYPLVATLLFLTACATQPVSMEEPRRVVGTENDVRIDAEVFGEKIASSQTLAIKYDITNNRSLPIAVADMVPDTTYDAETRTVTVHIGSEVPGAELLPRLVTIAPGEKKSFTIGARMNFPVISAYGVPAPNQLRLKLNFLGETKEFSQLLNISEKAVHDKQLADRLFPVWVERNEVVLTNTLPMRWGPADPSLMPADIRGGRRSTGGRP